MWERTLSQKSVRLFCEQKVIDEAKADAYVYGYELLISSVVSVLLVVLIAVVCGDVRYALSFLIGFIPQRIYIGIPCNIAHQMLFGILRTGTYLHFAK